ncbi:MAG: DeoR/GlpR family DNA-binding transcription regulator [Fimbriimonadaceae bacterium]
MSLTTQKRREWILEQLAARGHVGVRDLADGMSVSEATIRRDLRRLADSRLADLVYGGATTPRESDHSIQYRTTRQADAKKIIGRLAAELVTDGEMLYVDSGTTCYEMKAHLLRKRALTVIVNSTRLAVELGGGSEMSVIMIGGHYRPDRMDAVGPLAANAIDQLRGYLAFIGADGLSVDFGVSANEIQTAYLYQHVIKNARETILLADHTKFASPSLFRIADLDQVSRVVTDRRPDDRWVEALAARGIDLICPDQPADPAPAESPPNRSN